MECNLLAICLRDAILIIQPPHVCNNMKLNRLREIINQNNIAYAHAIGFRTLERLLP
jgi:hypothetical protein